jgi:hypothetical protein
MWKYKSVKTFERLSKIQPDTPEYEYSSVKEIDSKFKEFSKKVSGQLFPETATINQIKQAQEVAHSAK